jgi:hypothetical protein
VEIEAGLSATHLSSSTKATTKKPKPAATHTTTPAKPPLAPTNDNGSRFPPYAHVPASAIDHQILTHPCFVNRAHLSTVIRAHQGCVNTATWNSTDSLLLSGSDDCYINLWSYPLKKSLAYLNTGHGGNIFGARFVPGSNDKHIVTTAADGEQCQQVDRFNYCCLLLASKSCIFDTILIFTLPSRFVFIASTLYFQQVKCDFTTLAKATSGRVVCSAG